METNDEAAHASDASASQPAEQGSRAPVSGERAFLLTVAQRAKEAAAAGTGPSLRSQQCINTAKHIDTDAVLWYIAEWHTLYDWHSSLLMTVCEA